MQKILYGYPQSYWTGDLPTASKCIDVLKYCGEVDPLASRLQQVVQVYQDTLDARSAEHELGTDSPSVDRFDLEIPASCLFVLPPGNSDMHMVSRELLQLIRRPFQAAGLRRPGIALLESKPKIGVSLINAEETVMGAHLEWSWEISHHFKGQKSNETGDLGDDSTVTRDMLSQLGSGKLFKSRKASG